MSGLVFRKRRTRNTAISCTRCRKQKKKCSRGKPCEQCKNSEYNCVYDALKWKPTPKTGRDFEIQIKREENLNSLNPDEGGLLPVQFNAQASEMDGFEVNCFELNGLETQIKREENLNSPNPDEGGLPPAQFNAQASEMAAYLCPTSQPSPRVPPDILTAFFAWCHDNPCCFLDETATRSRIKLNRIPSYLLNAIYAVGTMFGPHPNGDVAAVELSKQYALRAIEHLEINSSVDSSQARYLLGVVSLTADKLMGNVLPTPSYTVSNDSCCLTDQNLEMEMHQQQSHPEPMPVPPNENYLEYIPLETGHHGICGWCGSWGGMDRSEMSAGTW